MKLEDIIETMLILYLLKHTCLKKTSTQIFQQRNRRQHRHPWQMKIASIAY